MTLSQFSLAGKTAVVTGGGSGLGAAIAEQFAVSGAYVVVLDRNEDGAANTIDTIRRSGGHGDAVIGSVACEADIEAAIHKATLPSGQLHVMANLAGVAARQDIAELDEALLDMLYTVHLKGTAMCTKHALRAMLWAGVEGSIINCASAAMDKPDRGLGAYAAMKAGICALTKIAAIEAGKQNIRCNAISPGLIITPMTRRYGNDENGVFDQARFDEWVNGITAGNALDRAGSCDDIANLALFLASDASRYVTGQIIRINGGVAMP